jgi:hypothetical protein
LIAEHAQWAIEQIEARTKRNQRRDNPDRRLY